MPMSNFTIYRNRTFETNVLCRVYRNLGKQTKLRYSIQQKIEGRWLVVAHTDDITLTRACANISETTRQRVIKNRKKEVHAYVYGYYSDTTDDSLTTTVTYNPYNAGHFYYAYPVARHIINMGYAESYMFDYYKATIWNQSVRLADMMYVEPQLLTEQFFNTHSRYLGQNGLGEAVYDTTVDVTTCFDVYDQWGDELELQCSGWTNNDFGELLYDSLDTGKLASGFSMDYEAGSIVLGFYNVTSYASVLDSITELCKQFNTFLKTVVYNKG